MYTLIGLGLRKNVLSVIVAVSMALLLLVPLAHAEETSPEETVQQEEQSFSQEEQNSEQSLPEAPENGQNGENDGEEPSVETQGGEDGTEGGPAEIQTGDALSLVESENGANKNDITTPYTASTTVENANDAAVENNATSEAATGDNEATGAGGASIETGDALASANVINVLNTNIVNSFGMFQFLNAIFGGGFDLRGLDLSYFFGNGMSGNCSLQSCVNGSMTINNTNNAYATTTVSVNASTGGNTAVSTGDGASIIRTGDAYASGNVINVINTNFVNSNYLLIAANNFGDMFGDISLPNADFFEQLLAQRASNNARTTDITNDNNAIITNSVTSEASTGGNTAETGDGTAIIETGDAVSSATTYNQANTNMVGGTTFYMLVNILGDWTGSVTGLPAGITWAHTPTGIMLMADNGAALPGDMGGGCCGNNASLTVENTNTANLASNLEVYALTGDNYAGAESGTAHIQTGNAYSSANTVNLVNINSIGQNWIFMIFNIFGDWDGNLSFGLPDLWIGGVAETRSPAQPGDLVTYRFTVSNMGDAKATNVQLSTAFDAGLLLFDEGGEWNLGDFEIGETREFTYQARAGNPQQRGGFIPVPLSATVTSDETDENPTDNTENLGITISTYTADPYSMQYAARGNWSAEPQVTITKTASVATTTLPATVDYTVLIENAGGTVYNAVLVDRLVGPDGEIVYEREWDLETVGAGEEIKLTYSIVFEGATLPGLYTNTAMLDGMKNSAEVAYAAGMEEVSARHVLELQKENGAGTVLGASFLKPACAAYITASLKSGSKNDSSQVRRLEYFLRDFEHEAITPDDTFDARTAAAVGRFQKKYADDVLEPWGIAGPTGIVYHTTKRKINEIWCQNIVRTAFPLSEIQETEILAFRSGIVGSNVAKKQKPKPEAEIVVAPTPEPVVTAEAEAPIMPEKPQPADETIKRTPTPTVRGNTNIFESFMDIFQWSQALLTVRNAEAAIRH